MLNRLRRVRIPLQQLAQPPSLPCQFCAEAASNRSKGKARAQYASRRPGHETSSIDWTQPSTSAIPYSPNLALQSRAYSNSASTSSREPERGPSATTSKLPFEELLNDPSTSVPTLLRAVSVSLPTLSRSAFDRLFDRLAESQSNSSSYLRHLKAIVEKERGWKLTSSQLRTVLRLSLLREKEHRIKRMRGERQGLDTRIKLKGGEAVREADAVEPTKEEARAIWAQRRRQNVTDALFKEYLPLVSNTKKVPKSQYRETEEVLQLFAQCAAIRPFSTTRDQDSQALIAFNLALDYARPSEGSVVIEDDVSEVIRRMFRAGREEEAMVALKKMAFNRRLLTARAMQDIVRDQYEEHDRIVQDKSDRSLQVEPNLLAQFDEPGPLSTSTGRPDSLDEYSHARQVLDQVCSSNAPSALDELLRLRLERVDRLEELERNPRGAFLKWLSLQGAGKSEWIEIALRMWKAGIETDEDGEAIVGTSYRKVLEKLVLKACQVEKTQDPVDEHPVLGSSSLLDYAANLALDYFPLQILTHHSHTLLSALTVDSHSPDLACALFDTVNNPPLDYQFARFQWSANLLIPFTRLFFFACRHKTDTSLSLRLYLSWTSSGMTFPASLWNPLWRALGQCESIDDLERVMRDWEESGRGPPASRIVRQVLQGAIKSGNIPCSLELVKFFRSRYSPSPLQAFPILQRTHLHPLVIPIDSYTALCSLLAHSQTDHRKTLSTLFSSLVSDGHRPTTAIFNALLVSNLHRRHFKVSDVDSAGVLYNSLVETGLSPDRDTFGLLMHGFNRMALERGGQGSEDPSSSSPGYLSIGIEASLRTFRASIAHLDRETTAVRVRKVRNGIDEAHEAVGTVARGGPVGTLMTLLARQGRFEEAKEVSEEWWKHFVKLEQFRDSPGSNGNSETEEDEGVVMRKALKEVGRLEQEELDRSKRNKRMSLS